MKQSMRALQLAVREGLANAIYRAVVEGYRAWVVASPRLYDSKENSITASLRPYIQEAARPLGGLLLVFFRDAVVDTQDIQQGWDDPNTAPRPDIVVTLGPIRCGFIECKWVYQKHPPGDHPRLYVTKGVCKFAEGGTYADLVPVNVMVGYLVDIQKVPAIITLINKHIVKLLGGAHELRYNGPIYDCNEAYESQAKTAVQHFFFEVPFLQNSP